jgi:hypothetical protein
MAPIPGTVRRAFAAAAFAVASLFVSASVFATPPSLTPKVLQCDGVTYLTGSVTSHPNPTVLVEQQSLTPGLKIGQRRLSLRANSTLALWRFDSNFEVTRSACFTTGCSGGDSCQTWTWIYNDSNNSADLQTGQCTYRDTSGVTCANTMALYTATQEVVPLGGACPASTTTLTSAIGVTNVAISPVGPLVGLASDGLSAQALQLNGSSLYATAANSASWDLPSSYTLSAWINTTVDGRIVSQQGATGKWGIAVSGGGLRHFDSRDVSVGDDVTRGSGLGAVPPLAGWHLVHLVRTNGIDRRFFIDGRLVGTVAAASSSTFQTHPINATLEIGRRGDAPSEYFNGKIDDVRILNSAMTDDDIMLEWNTQIHKYSSNSGITFSTYTGSYSGSPAYGTAGVVTYIPPEAYTAASRWMFLAQSTYSESAIGSSYGVTIDNSPPVAPNVSALATPANGITWTWGAPPHVCVPPGSASVTYRLIGATDGAILTGDLYPALTVGETIPGAPNQLISRKLRVTDTWGTGLSAATSIYTQANPPLAASVVPSAVSTGSALISWSQNGNPSYTRYLLSYAQNATFTVGLTTPTTMASNFTGSSLPVPGLATGTTYFARVQAFSGRFGDVYGDAETVLVSTSFTTLPAAPGLSGAPIDNVSITWSWTSVQGARYYNLYNEAGGLLYTGGALSSIQAGLTTNTQYVASIEAVSGNGTGTRSAATIFTKANNPTLTGGGVNAVYSSSITYVWNSNLNPAYTFYELTVTTDATFGIIVATMTVSATTATVTGLFPNTRYYARVSSINGSQLYGSTPATFNSALTTSDPSITVIPAPSSAYVAPNGSKGQWNFDESTGTTAADTSGYGNTAALTCLTASCVSTPTFVAGPTGLGSAASFSGLAGSLALIPSAAQYNFNDNLTVSAWVNPSSLTQPNGAGIVVHGNGGAETFGLDVSAGLYRFMATPAKIAIATSAITPGTWTHLIGVYDSAAGTATLYVNGRTAPAMTVAAVPLRSLVAHAISIGNRQSGAGAYDLGFLGSIDAVRVQNRALSAAEALAEYQGSFITTVTPPSPNDTILIGLAPNAFGAAATLFVSIDPMTHPITITPAVLNAGLTVIPTGFALVPNSLIEIVPMVGGSPFTQTLGSSATISMPYADANGNNIIDGSSPPMAASAIKVYTLNTTVNRWEALQTFVDPASRRVTVFTPHFSVFAMFAPNTIGTSLTAVRVYPVPWKPGTHGRFDAAAITFDRLPVSGVIRILNIAGERVREFTFDGAASGSASWNGVTDGGRRAASGVYFARITGEDGATALVKFAIER